MTNLLRTICEFAQGSAVPSAPEAAGVRVWEVISRGRGPRMGCPPPEGVAVAYPLVQNQFLFDMLGATTLNDRNAEHGWIRSG